MRFTLNHLLRPFRQNKEYTVLLVILGVFTSLRLFSCAFVSEPPLAPKPRKLPQVVSLPKPTLDVREKQIQDLWGNVYGPTPVGVATSNPASTLKEMRSMMDDIP
jgi:hypothetical protein